MKSVLLLTLTLIASLSLASTPLPQDCATLRAEQVRVALRGSNLTNLNTTRTPEGGPYQPFEIKSCDNSGCDTTRSNQPIMKHQPGHPDADANGYVAYPHMNKKFEYKEFNSAALKLKLLALSKACGTEVVDNKDSILISYVSEKTGAQEDIFNFDKNQQVVSWMRKDQNGVFTAVNFNPDGEAHLATQVIPTEALPAQQ